MDEIFSLLVAAARRSSDAVLCALEVTTRAAEPSIDAMLFFADDGEALCCRFARGARTEHFHALRLARGSQMLPARAALLALPVVLERGARGLIPSDRAAIAVPMLSQRRVHGVWYAATSSARRLSRSESIARLASVASEPYLLALEREADHREAIFDALTGVLTPRAFRRLLHELVASASEPVLSLWFVDTDRFKSINDEHGHAAGDLVLQRMAALLRAHAVPDRDAVGRKGGDEFCVLLRGPQKMRAIQRARRFCDAVRVTDFGVPLRLTASVGVAAFPFDADTAPTLLEAADAAMYHAKRSGRDRVAYAVEGTGFALYE